MDMKSVTASLVLVTGIGFGATAHAQIMVGNQEVTDAELLAVTEHCRTLAMGSDVKVDGTEGNIKDPVAPASPQNDLASGKPATTGIEGNPDHDMPDPAMAGTADRTIDDTSGTSGNPGNDTSLNGSVNLQMITLADCQAAGL